MTADADRHLLIGLLALQNGIISQVQLVAAWELFLEKGPAQARAFIAQTLRHWQQDTDLASVRETEALAKLPEEERKAWRTLWAVVDDLGKKAEQARP